MTGEAAVAAHEPAAWQRSWRRRATVAMIAWCGAPLIRLLAATYRYEVEGAAHLADLDAAAEPYILAVWHGRILPGVWFWRGRGIVVITSQNFDGEWIARILARFGFGTARGSTSRGGARALRQLLRDIARRPAAFTVDGPRGPARVLQPGVVWLARASGHPVLPFHAEADRHWTLRSWDRTQIPKPFARVALVIGAPLRVARDVHGAGLDRARQDVTDSLVALEARCHAVLAGAGRPS